MLNFALVSVLLGSSSEADNGVMSSMLITIQEQRQIPSPILSSIFMVTPIRCTAFYI